MDKPANANRNRDEPIGHWNAYGDPNYFSMGRGSYGGPTVHVYRGDTNRVTVGNYTSIALDTEFMVGGNHAIDWVTTWPIREKFDLPGAWTGGTPWSRGDINVGSDVWICRGARILSGVTIGHGAVIGAYAVVSRDVRPYAVVTGNPATEVRRRFDDDLVDGLLAIQWWEWPEEQIRERWQDLVSSDVAAFVLKYRASAAAVAETGR